MSLWIKLNISFLISFYIKIVFLVGRKVLDVGPGSYILGKNSSSASQVFNIINSLSDAFLMLEFYFFCSVG